MKLKGGNHQVSVLKIEDSSSLRLFVKSVLGPNYASRITHQCPLTSFLLEDRKTNLIRGLQQKSLREIDYLQTMQFPHLQPLFFPSPITPQYGSSSVSNLSKKLKA